MACLDEPVDYDDIIDDEEEEFEWLTVDQQEEESNSDDSDQYHHHDDGDVTTKPVRRRRRRKHSFLVIPRLFKRDIRRFYATMLANVSNSHDYSLFYGFFRTYAASDMVIKRHRVGSSLQALQTMTAAYSSSCTAMAPRDSGGSGVHEIQGILSYANALYCATQMNPDQVVSVHNVQVLTRPASDISRVTFDMEVRFTHLYDLPPVVFVDNVLTVVNEYLTALAAAAGNDHIESTTTTTTTTHHAIDGGGMATLSTPHLMATLPVGAEALRPLVDPFQLCPLVCGRPIRLSAKPVPILVRVRTVLHLDERRRITVVEATDISYAQQ
jgi:hypothetical protein